MIRKSLFWGLTLILVIAFVSLLIRGRQMEKQQQSVQQAEVVEESRSSPTRVLRPDDLQVVSSIMQRKDPGYTLHELEIRNNGSVPYSGIQLAFVYLDRTGKVVLSRIHSLDGQPIRPGAAITVPGIRVQGVPASASKFQVSILSADMLPADAN